MTIRDTPRPSWRAMESGEDEDAEGAEGRTGGGEDAEAVEAAEEATADGSDGAAGTTEGAVDATMIAASGASAWAIARVAPAALSGRRCPQLNGKVRLESSGT